jgi:acyl-CoA thioester hydrolase
MSELIPTYRGAVMPWHCDHMDHMNVMWYVGKFDEATWNFMALLGLSAAELRLTRRGLAAVDQHIQYRRELHAGDTLSIASGMLEVRDKTFRFFHEMRNNATGEVNATSRYVVVYMDTQARKACPIPDPIRKRAREFMREYDFGD